MVARQRIRECQRVQSSTAEIQTRSSGSRSIAVNLRRFSEVTSEDNSDLNGMSTVTMDSLSRSIDGIIGGYYEQ